MLFLATYIFLLRLASEALPITSSCIGEAGNGEQANLYMEGDFLCLKLGRRKNKPDGLLVQGLPVDLPSPYSLALVPETRVGHQSFC